MGVRKEGGLWRVQIQVKGRRFSTTARTREEAEGIAAKHRRDRALSRQGLPPERSLEDALTRWLDEYVPNLKRPGDYESHIRALVPHCVGRSIEEMPEVWQAYRDSNKQLTASTHNRRGAVLRRVATLSHRWGWCGPGLADRIQLLPENPARHVYLTPADVQQLARACRYQPTRDAVMIAAYAGLRVSEILALEKRDVQDGCLTVRESKSGKPRVVPVHDAIKAAVQRLPLKLGRWAIRDDFDAARAKLNRWAWRFHDLRHTNASWLIQNGADLVTVRDLLGHSSLAVTGRYAHLGTSHLRAAVDRIPLVRQPKLHRAKKK